MLLCPARFVPVRSTLTPLPPSLPQLMHSQSTELVSRQLVCDEGLRLMLAASLDHKAGSECVSVHSMDMEGAGLLAYKYRWGARAELLLAAGGVELVRVAGVAIVGVSGCAPYSWGPQTLCTERCSTAPVTPCKGQGALTVCVWGRGGGGQCVVARVHLGMA
jgi:hypothetical protein